VTRRTEDRAEMHRCSASATTSSSRLTCGPLCCDRATASLPRVIDGGGRERRTYRGHRHMTKGLIAVARLPRSPCRVDIEVRSPGGSAAPR
jgi:hypothetical protein